MASPSKRTAPCVGRTRPEITFSVVDLPAPLAPSSATIWPRGTASDTSCSAEILPYEAEMDSTDSRGSVMVASFTQIRLDHALVVADLGGRALGDLVPERHHRNAIRNRHDQLHDVLDQQHRDALARGQFRQNAVELVDLAVAQPGSGLVQQ